jgi:hypothetical protein
MATGRIGNNGPAMDDPSIQDIHVDRNLIQRWSGIGKVEIQAVAGSSSAEPAFDGMDHWDPVRDDLHRRMRGTGASTGEGVSSADPAVQPTPGKAGEAVELVRAITHDIDAVRRAFIENTQEVRNRIRGRLRRCAASTAFHERGWR